IDNVLLIHSLRPHSLTGHMTLYKSVLHNANNTLPKWYLESIGVYVSYLNGCDYCVAHHFAGLKRLLEDDGKAERFFSAVQHNALETCFDRKYFSGMEYAGKLTEQPRNIGKADVERLGTLGFSDGEVLEINQVTSYFNYVNRIVLGLGVSTKGDVLGLSPNDSEDPGNWT
ncbi:MAG: peroxidase-related enzyme, partial [Sinomicrobium sp.]|nr:peroxidase-related enzyme [Sinomicrobium sp.]